MRLDAGGVADLVGRFGDLHDSVIRKVSWELDVPRCVALEIDALALDGTWSRVVLTVEGVSELRLAEGAAIWNNEPSWRVTTHHADGSAVTETRARDLTDLRLSGPTNQVIFEAAIHVVPEGVLIDLSPVNAGAPVSTSPAEWRSSTFYIFGKSATARVSPLEHVEKSALLPARPAADSLGATLLRHGAITKFFSPAPFQRTIAELAKAGYRAHMIDADDATVFRAQMTRALRFKENFGYEPWTGNLDALNDAFRSVDFAGVAGVAFAFTRFDLLLAAEPRLAEGVVDVLESASREHLVAGSCLIGLVQSDDPRLELPPCGARPPTWNEEEWPNKARGV